MLLEQMSRINVAFSSKPSNFITGEGNTGGCKVKVMQVTLKVQAPNSPESRLSFYQTTRPHEPQVRNLSRNGRQISPRGQGARCNRTEQPLSEGVESSFVGFCSAFKVEALLFVFTLI